MSASAAQVVAQAIVSTPVPAKAAQASALALAHPPERQARVAQATAQLIRRTTRGTLAQAFAQTIVETLPPAKAAQASAFVVRGYPSPDARAAQSFVQALTRAMRAQVSQAVLQAIIFANPSDPARPRHPMIVSVTQLTTTGTGGVLRAIVVFGITQATLTGDSPIVAYKLYRASVKGGAFTLIAQGSIDQVLVATKLTDALPVVGSQQFYFATAIDAQGRESTESNSVSFSAHALAASGTGASLSAEARGPYPLLGGDVFLDPTTGEAVIGPNGDLLTVNGLYCLGQDLRLRIFTDYGELPMHPDYGFSRAKVIGSGQAKPQVQAQILRADIMDMLNKEARVFQVLDVQINQSASDAWVIGYDVMAIGVEDVQHFNLVIGFY